MLLRHAKAEPGGHGADALRRLEPRGRRQCTDVGARLAASGLAPERVIVSSAVRTTETWDGVRAALGDVPEPEVETSDVLYRAGLDEVLELVRATDDRVRTLLVIGHEPAMSTTLGYVAGGGDPAALAQAHAGLPTAAFGVLELDTGWAELQRLGAVLRDVVRPAS